MLLRQSIVSLDLHLNPFSDLSGKNLRNINFITDNKKFWKTVKPAFSDKLRQSKKIVLVNNDDIYLMMLDC